MASSPASEKFDTPLNSTSLPASPETRTIPHSSVSPRSWANRRFSIPPTSEEVETNLADMAGFHSGGSPMGAEATSSIIDSDEDLSTTNIAHPTASTGQMTALSWSFPSHSGATPVAPNSASVPTTPTRHSRHRRTLSENIILGTSFPIVTPATPKIAPSDNLVEKQVDMNDKEEDIIDIDELMAAEPPQEPRMNQWILTQGPRPRVYSSTATYSHRRTESAPSSLPAFLGSPGFRQHNATMPDVFEEDEEDLDEAPAAPTLVSTNRTSIATMASADSQATTPTAASEVSQANFRPRFLRCVQAPSSHDNRRATSSLSRGNDQVDMLEARRPSHVSFDVASFSASDLDSAGPAPSLETQVSFSGIGSDRIGSFETGSPVSASSDFDKKDSTTWVRPGTGSDLRSSVDDVPSLISNEAEMYALPLIAPSTISTLVAPGSIITASSVLSLGQNMPNDGNAVDGSAIQGIFGGRSTRGSMASFSRFLVRSFSSKREHEHDMALQLSDSAMPHKKRSRFSRLMHFLKPKNLS